jgi:FkbM family methyltransferase
MTDVFGLLRRPLHSSTPIVSDLLGKVRLAMGERSYSQEGEDRILARLFESSRQGFYVDVGAHHPMRYSNTFLFYRRGWRGVNIDAMPGSMRLFDRYRSRDTNIEAGIGLTTGVVPFYVFNEPALNSFDRELSESRTAPYKIQKVIDVPVLPLSEVLRGCLPRESMPSFLTVDVEGRDLEVLRSNDWSAFRPTYVLTECLGTTMAEAVEGPVALFMSSVGYESIAKTVNTVFYQVRA